MLGVAQTHPSEGTVKKHVCVKGERVHMVVTIKVTITPFALVFVGTRSMIVTIPPMGPLGGFVGLAVPRLQSTRTKCGEQSL